MITITRLLEADVGHRLLNHEGKCAHAHGHRYRWHIECCAPALDSVGRVIDFSVVKALVGTWIDDHLDHAFVAQTGDPILEWLRENGQRHHEVQFPPTAENLAAYVAMQAMRLLPEHIKVVSVICWETPNCFAVWSAE